MKALINTSPIQLFNSLPKFWEDTFNFDKATPEIHYKSGFRDVINPELAENQKLGALYYDKGNDVVTYEVISMTDEEIKSRADEETAAKQSELIEQKKTEQALNSFQIITDESEALAVKEVYPPWTTEENYLKRNVGYKVTRTMKGEKDYEVRLFSLIQPHTPQDGWEPENYPAGWSEIKASGELEVWTQPIGGDGKYPYLNSSTNLPYQVSHEGQTWKNIYQADLNVWKPGEFGWEVVPSK